MNFSAAIKSIGVSEIVSLLIGGLIYGLAMYFLGLKDSPWVVSTMIGGFIVSLPMMVIYRSIKLR